MFDIRYHIVSIVAVFLMLGAGILIGERIALPAQIKQQTRSLAALQEQVDGAVQDGREAKRRLAHVEHAVDVLRGRVVPGKLAGKHVDIILCGDYTHAAYAAATAVLDAGAVSVAQIGVSDKLVDISQDDRDELLQRINGDTGSTDTTTGGSGDSSDSASTALTADTSQTNLLAPLMSVLHSGTATSDNGDTVVTQLENEQYITVTGDISQPCSLFVIVGGRNDDGNPPANLVEDTESALIEDLLNTGADVEVVGCEPSDAVVSSIPNYQKERIATVDCIDQPLGQLDLPFALHGGIDKADYGLKSTAARELPPSLEGPGH